MINTILTIRVDITRLGRPTADELRQTQYESELDFWLDLLYSDPPQVLDGARFALVEEDV